jgi:hypothetical protein
MLTATANMKVVIHQKQKLCLKDGSWLIIVARGCGVGIEMVGKVMGLRNM